MRKSFEYIKKMKFGIIGDYGLIKNYIAACKDLEIDYEIIDIFSNNWLYNVKKSNVDGILVYARKSNDVIMNMYDERLYFVNKKLGIPIYPSYDEIFIYENKKNDVLLVKV